MAATVSILSAPESDDGGQPSAASAARAAELGRFLAAARHRSGLALEDISATTKVAVRHLAALERGAIDQLPGGVYRRAWVRSYAVAVGLPPETALERFDRIAAPPPAPDERSPATPNPHPGCHPRPHLVPRPTVHRYRFLGGVLSAAALVAVALLLRSERGAPSAGDDSRVLTGESAAREATRGTGSRRSDIALVPDDVPQEPIPDPRLVITSRPSGARVTVNGIGWGMTPLTIRNLPPGPKLIRATKDGFIGREASVELGLADSDEFVRLTLERRE